MDKPIEHLRDTQTGQQLWQQPLQLDILSHVRDAVIGLDKDNRVFLWNRAAEEMYGVPAVKAHGRDCNFIFKEEWLQPVDALDAGRALATTGVWDGENIHLLTNGQVVYVESYVSLLKDKDGNGVGLLKVIRDASNRRRSVWEKERLLGEIVRERQKVDKALNEAERETDIRKTIMENAGALIAYFDRDFNFVLANAAYTSNCGLTERALIGRNYFDLFPDEENLATYRRVRDTGKPAAFHDKPFVYPNRPGRGVTYWDWVLTPVKDASGVVQGLVSSLMETTSRRRAEEAQHQSEANFRTLVESAPDGIVALSPDGRIVECNDWMCWLTAYPREKILGEKLGRFIKEQKPHTLEKDLERLSAQKNIETEFSIRRGDGSLVQAWAKMVWLAMPDKRSYIVIYMRDITERRHVDQLKDDFIAMVSHEMRTPLTVIIGGLITLSQDGARLTEQERQQMMEDAILASEELSHMLDNLLELSRSQAERLKICRTSVALYDVVQKVVYKVNKKSLHRYVVDVSPRLPLIEADPLRLERVIHNLVQNASRYSPQGKEIRIFARKQDSEIVVGVHDEGSGLGSEDIEKLFNPFQRGDDADKTAARGVGLGLVVCRRLIEAHGGRIWLESHQGEGTTCYFTLPLKVRSQKTVAAQVHA